MKNIKRDAVKQVQKCVTKRYKMIIYVIPYKYLSDFLLTFAVSVQSLGSEKKLIIGQSSFENDII